MNRFCIRMAGFSLLELLVVMAVVAILTAIAVPVYRQHVVKTRQAEARALLLENAHFLERWYGEKGSFKASSNAWPALPASRVPPAPETPLYQIGFTASAINVDEGEYTLEAMPVSGQDWLGGISIQLDQDGNIRYCEPNASGGRSCRLP
ncbi:MULTISPECIES: type IV pilin protein [Gulbenkiania]|uniref:Prepilin-type N-terminal cleavage/methylation domain n=1 Tax=Gulbenkiania indica TaxID=375574 RepID=A0A0K6GTA9_9NEIS|nr:MULTISPECIES: type IV pilin protein [Gulbenkiania]CUA81867.1 prepilin-type N-terminal cleavage/methylation domain [Gulbenkiania indica]